MNKNRLPILVAEMYRVVNELEHMFPGRHFTPDGHLIGSLGECLAAYHYDLTLLSASSEGRDAEKAGKSIEIKATQGARIALRSNPEHLLVLKLDRIGGFNEIFNGPGHLAWEIVKDKPRPSNGQYQISLAKLAMIMESVPRSYRIPMTIPNNYKLPTAESSG